MRPKQVEDGVQVGLWIDRHVLAHLDAFCQGAGISRAQFIRWAVTERLAKDVFPHGAVARRPAKPPVEQSHPQFQTYLRRLEEWQVKGYWLPTTRAAQPRPKRGPRKVPQGRGE